ncbi:MAG: Toluene efflux pump periplasmic linker protein TtgD [Gammaproteobacteria bacterium]|nr:Toluene efflux pump periplasmic linker protein TtgD [Gammaproteobacteria bacterium]
MSNIYTSDYPPSRPTPLLGIAALLALAACHGQPPAAAPPAAVLAQPVHSYAGDGGESLRYPVEVAARYANVMSFRVGGKLIERKVRLGDPVHKGQVVARLDAVDAEKQASAARAALDAAEHRLAFAKQQLERDEAQFAQNLIAANQMEQTEDTFSSALAARDQSADQWVVARHTLQYNVLVADHDGLITSENADTGQVLTAGQAVYGLAWSGDIDVDLDAAANDVAKISAGQHATVTFPALPGRRFAARVRELAPAADPQSRTYRVKLTLTEGTAAVRIGMTGDALMTPADQDNVSGARAAPAHALPLFRIPATAVFHRGKDPAVWLIRSPDSILELRPVTVRGYSERSAIVSGLADGDNLVWAGVHTVYAGQHVKPVKPLFTGDESAETPPTAIDDASASHAADGRR